MFITLHVQNHDSVDYSQDTIIPGLVQGKPAYSLDTNSSGLPLSVDNMFMSPSFHRNKPALYLLQNEYPMLARAKIRKSKPKALLDHTEPTNVK